jgi:hypothetical protein
MSIECSPHCKKWSRSWALPRERRDDEKGND